MTDPIMAHMTAKAAKPIHLTMNILVLHYFDRSAENPPRDLVDFTVILDFLDKSGVLLVDERYLRIHQLIDFFDFMAIQCCPIQFLNLGVEDLSRPLIVQPDLFESGNDEFGLLFYEVVDLGFLLKGNFLSGDFQPKEQALAGVEDELLFGSSGFFRPKGRVIKHRDRGEDEDKNTKDVSHDTSPLSLDHVIRG